MSDETKPQEGTSIAGQEPAEDRTHNPTQAEALPHDQESDGDINALPVWARRKFAELARENANHRKAKQDAEAAAKAAEDNRLAEEKRFQELAEKRASRIAELEPIAEKYQRLTDRMIADMEAEIAKFPAEVKAMRPNGADLDSLIDWTEKARKLAAAITAQQTPGAGPLPKPANATARPAQTQAAAIAAMRNRF